MIQLRRNKKGGKKNEKIKNYYKKIEEKTKGKADDNLE
jgi:hypothetical protein